jgi:phage shock protein PspC (stress-responsive transcriptional regulator)
MKKQASVNIGGYVFVLEENVYEYLDQYLNGIRDSLEGTPEEIQEIINDIEQRIGELLSNKIISNKDTVTREHIDEIIQTMGKPEDYKEPDSESKENSRFESRKKLYRNPKDRLVGGVASGMAYYLGIDTTIMRLIWLLVIFLTGIGVLAYIILWILLPNAGDRISYMEMQGEQINIENIKKKIKEEYDELKKTDMSKVSRFIRNVSEKIELFFNRLFQGKS